MLSYSTKKLFHPSRQHFSAGLPEWNGFVWNNLWVICAHSGYDGWDLKWWSRKSALIALQELKNCDWVTWLEIVGVWAQRLETIIRRLWVQISKLEHTICWESILIGPLIETLNSPGGLDGSTVLNEGVSAVTVPVWRQSLIKAWLVGLTGKLKDVNVIYDFLTGSIDQRNNVILLWTCKYCKIYCLQIWFS